MPTAVTKANPYAKMEENNGSEDVEGKVRHLVERTYTIRYNKDVLDNGHNYKVVDGSLTFDIYHVKELARKRFLKLLVTVYE